MRGKLIEDVLYGAQVKPADRLTATLYNGGANSVTGNAIQGAGYQELDVLVSVGTIVGSASLDVSLVTSDTDLPSGATAVTGATLTASASNTLKTGAILTSKLQTYTWVKTVVNGTGTIPFGITTALRSDINPVANSPVFDVDEAS